MRDIILLKKGQRTKRKGKVRKDKLLAPLGTTSILSTTIAIVISKPS